MMFTTNQKIIVTEGKYKGTEGFFRAYSRRDNKNTYCFIYFYTPNVRGAQVEVAHIKAV